MKSINIKISRIVLGIMAAVSFVSGCKKTYKDPREFAEKYVIGEIESRYGRDLAGFKGIKILTAEVSSEAIPMYGTLEKITCSYYPEFDPDEKYYYPLDTNPAVLKENNLELRKNTGIGYFANMRGVLDDDRVERLRKAARKFLDYPPKFASELPEISKNIMKNPVIASGKVEVYRTKNSDGIYVPMKLAINSGEVLFGKPCAVIKERVWNETTTHKRGYIIAITFSGDTKAPALGDMLETAEKEGRKVTRKDIVGNETVTAQARLAVDTFNSKYDELKTREEEINKISIEIANFDYREKGRRADAQRRFEAKIRQELEALVKELEKELSFIDPDPLLVRGRRGTMKISALHSYDEKLATIAKDRHNTETKIQKATKNRDKDLSSLASMQDSLSKNPRNPERIRKNIADTEARIAQTELSIVSSEEYLRNLAAQEESVRSERTTKETELQALKAANQDKIAALNAQISAKKAENKEIYAQKIAAFAAEWEADAKKRKDDLMAKLEYNFSQVEEMLGLKSQMPESKAQEQGQTGEELGFGWSAR